MRHLFIIFAFLTLFTMLLALLGNEVRNVDWPLLWPTSTPVPTTLTPTPVVSILWSADHETGDLSQWTQDQDGQAVYNSGTGVVTITTTVAHSGHYALRLSISDADGQSQAARIFRWNEDQQEAYYSAWLYFPQRYTASWWIVWQWKSKDPTIPGSDPTWALDVGNRSNGSMYFYLVDVITQQWYRTQLTPLDIPVGKWVHVEGFFRHTQDMTGHVIIWQDGVKLFDIAGVQTALHDHVHWGLANYSGDITPGDVTIYADDAVISTSGTTQ